MIQSYLNIMIQKLHKKLQVDLISSFSFLLLVFCLLLVFHFVFRQRVYPGIKAANVNLTAKTQKQAVQILKEISSKQKNKLRLKFENQVWEISLVNLEFAYLSENTSKKAYLIGRSGNLKKDSIQKIKGLRGKINLGLEYEINQKLLETAINNIATQIDIPQVPPTIQIFQDKITGSRIEIQKGQSGRKVEQEKLINSIDEHLAYMFEPNITIPVKTLLPEITQEQVELTRIRAEKLLDKNLDLSFEKNSWQLSEAQLINFLDFSDGFDEGKIASFTAQLAKSVDRQPQNALFNFLLNGKAGQNGRVIEFKPAKNGQALEQKQTKLLIEQSLKVLEKSESQTSAISLPVNLTEPEITTEQVNNLGIKELIGRGESWFAGSISSRIHNIQLASSQINGLLIAPGDTFSLNQALGDISIQTGYKKAWIIKEGRTVLGDGGGVCQASTTLFRAILNAGLPIIERSAHAYRVSYYEQKYQVGVDATVFAPSPDLKFKNDTPSHILLQTYVDPVNLYARYDLYGTSDDRQIYISDSRIWEQTPPPPDLYQDDPTLANGVVKQIDWAAWGAKTAFDWKVVRNDETLQERTFYSNYKPWQAIFLRGTGP